MLMSSKEILENGLVDTAQKGESGMNGESSIDIYIHALGFQGGASGKEPICQCRRLKRHRFNPWEGKLYTTMCKVDS